LHFAEQTRQQHAIQQPFYVSIYIDQILARKCTGECLIPVGDCKQVLCFKFMAPKSIGYCCDVYLDTHYQPVPEKLTRIKFRTNVFSSKIQEIPLN